MSPEYTNKFPFKEEICKRFCKWLNIKDGKEIDDALENLTGDTYFEMRKLISVLLAEIEIRIEQGLYPGYLNGKPLTTEQKKNIIEVREDLKEFIKFAVEYSWREILKKQKIGMDSLTIALKPYIHVDENTDMEPGDK